MNPRWIFLGFRPRWSRRWAGSYTRDRKKTPIPRSAPPGARNAVRPAGRRSISQDCIRRICRRAAQPIEIAGYCWMVRAAGWAARAGCRAGRPLASGQRAGRRAGQAGDRTGPRRAVPGRAARGGWRGGWPSGGAAKAKDFQGVSRSGRRMAALPPEAASAATWGGRIGSRCLGICASVVRRNYLGI